MVLDWLYDTIPSEQVGKIEVYTFGNAANHFNAPIISCLNSKGKRADKPHVMADEKGAIRHIEHYANTGDYVSRFGILHFRPCATGGTGATDDDDDVQVEENRFVGRLFKREGCGHQMNGNYLDNLFPMNKDMNEVLENNEFMDGVVDIPLFKECAVVQVRENGSLANSGEKQQGLRVKDLSRLWQYRNGMSPSG